MQRCAIPRLLCCFLVCVVSTALLSDLNVQAQPPPFVGPPQGVGQPAYDDVVLRLMNKWQLPGGSVAVARAGRLVMARGSGLADVEDCILVAPSTLFRIASMSKTVTAIAAMQLVEDGKLALDSPAFALLSDLAPRGGPVDPRLERVTVGELLQHTGGWDRDLSFDPMFIPYAAALEVGD